jgi:molybdopterin-containing oxidoreductase family membrane subunit
MLELAIKGSKRYYAWMTLLMGVVGAGFLVYLWQLDFGLGITGLSRDTSWGFYIANFTFLVGVAAGGVMVVLPYYLHDYKAFGRVTILGEFLAIASVIMCVTFILVDLGQPQRIFNVFIYLSPRSVLFWDTVVLNGYLFLNIIIGWNVLEAERNGVHYQKWLKPLIYISIPWAISIHTVTAYLYCGLPGRGFWMTAILAPRFLSSAFAAGPALLILLCLIIRRVSSFDPGREQIQSLAKIVAYAISINVFFFLCEVFVAFYSQNPITRKNEGVLAVACVLIFLGTWIDKGLGMIAGGFTPNPLHHVNEYIPSLPEIMIALAVWAMGFLILTVLFKIAVGVKEEGRS